eukprot:SAG11_NODE_1822_length_4207_cov_1.736125_3_plen_68_part_00
MVAGKDDAILIFLLNLPGTYDGVSRSVGVVAGRDDARQAKEGELEKILFANSDPSKLLEALSTAFAR